MPSYHEGPFIDKIKTTKAVTAVGQWPDGAPKLGQVDVPLL